MATKIKTSALTPELRQYMSATKKKNEQTSPVLGNELMEFLNKRKENGTLLSGMLSDEERQSYIDKTSAVKTERFKQSERAEADRRAAQQAKRQAAMTAPGVVDSVEEAEKATLGDNVRYIQERGRNAFATFNENLNTLGEGIYQGGKAFFGEFAKPGNDSQLDDALSAFWSGYKSAMDKAAEENYSARIEAETEEKFKNSAANPAVKTIADAVSSVNTMLPSMAVSAAAGPVGAGVMLGAQTMPGAYIQARNDGATQDQAMAYSALEAVNAGAGEFLIGGLLGKGTGLIGKGANAITKGAVGRFVGNLSNSLAKSPIGKTLISAGAKSLGEGAEEVAQGLISTLNERMTYNPEAKVDAGELAYEGLLGSLMGGAFQTINLPAQYQAYRSDYDTVNGFSLAADAVRSAEDVDVLKKIGGSIIEQADGILSDKKADNDVIQRTSYVKQGVQKTLDLLENNSEKIIGGNVNKADALETVISSAPENAVDNLISYVNAVSDGADANTAVKKAVDFVRGEIQNARNLLAETENSSVRTRLTENLINYQEVESTLRNKRKEIVSLLDKKKAAPAESAADTNADSKTETVESASETVQNAVVPNEEASAEAETETAEAPETVPAKEEAEPVRGAADYDDLSTALGVELTGNAEEDARVLLDSYRGARRAAKAVLASATAEGVSDNVRAYGKTLDSEIRRLNKSHAQKAANAARIALKKYGVENVVVDENAGDIGVNGYYDRETNTIHISPYVSEDGAVGRVILHEFTHRGAQADYSLVDAILGAREKLASSGWFEKNHKDLYSREVYEKAYADKVAGKSEAEAKAEIDEEIAAHFMEQIMEDENILEALAREDRTVLQRILDTIRDFFDKGGRENRMAERAVQKIEAVLNKSAAAKAAGVKVGGNSANAKSVSVEDIKESKRFSLEFDVEKSGDLIAVHNLSEEKLNKAFKLGGFPMPSVAIVRAKDGFEEFGDISLIFSKDTVDPEFMRSNKIYSGDAWTPTYPRVEYKVNESVRKQVEKKIKSLVPYEIMSDLGRVSLDSSNIEDTVSRFKGDMAEAYRNDIAMKYAFLKDGGSDITLPMKEAPLYIYGESSNEAVRYFAGKLVNGLQTVELYQNMSASDLLQDKDLKEGVADAQNFDVLRTLEPGSDEYLAYERNPVFHADEVAFRDIQNFLSASRKLFTTGIQQAVDYKAAREFIDDQTDQNAYEAWLREQFAGIVEKEGIRNNVDYFTPSGNRRSFEATHWENTLENVVRAMKETGEKGIGNFGGGNIFGASTKEFTSIADVKKSTGRLQNIPEEEYEKMKNEFRDRFFELASSLPENKRSFAAADDAANMLIEAVVKYKTKNGMANYIRRESQGWAKYSPEVVDELIDIVNDIRAMPTGYFEAKPQRAVSIDEISAFVVPDDIKTETRELIGSTNAQVVEYEHGNEQSRLNALNSLKDVRFSRELEDVAITREDIEALRLLPRKSVNDFTSDDIKKTEKWARKFYQELGVKSPFFRAWFGDWRANDRSAVRVVEAKNTEYKAGKAHNSDMNRDISWGSDMKRETVNHAVKDKISINALNDIGEIVENSVYFDTVVSSNSSKTKMPNTAFMHSLYTLYNEGGNVYLLKLYVEEALSNNEKYVFSRAYELKDIEKVAEVTDGVHFKKEGLTDVTSATTYSVSELYSYVKRYDKDFSSSESSKVVNYDGTPKVMYHGSPNEFTVFDKKKSKPSNLYGRGFYFSDSDAHAKTYGSPYEVYLDVKNPLTPNVTTITEDQIRTFLEAVAENEDDYSIENYGTYDVDEILEGITSRDAFAVIQDVNATAIGDFAEAIELFNKVNGTKFDGIITNTETVVFKPEQIKSATDNRGTFDKNNPNIRYSRELSDEAYLEAVESGDMEAAQAMVDEAARAHGYPVKAYHGTPTGGFTKFDPSRIGSNTGVGRGRFSFTSDKSVADSYSGKNNKNARASDLVTDLNSLFRKHDSDELRVLLVDDAEIPVVWDSDIVIAEGAYDHDYIQFDEDWEDNTPELYANAQEARTAKAAAEFEGTRRYLIDTLKDYRKGADSSLDEFFDEAIAMLESKSPDRNPETYSVYLKTPTAEFEADPKTYNSVAWDAAYSGDDVVVIHLDNGEDRYFVNNPSSIKSADTIVYDDNGNVIPLSERFKDSNDDIRYSRELESEEQRTIRRQQERIDYLSKQLRSHTAFGWAKAVSPTARRDFASEIAAEIPGVSTETVSEAIKEVWDIFEAAKKDSSDTPEARVNAAVAKAREVAERIVSESATNEVNPMYEQYNDLRNRLRNTPVRMTISENEFGGETDYRTWRRGNIGLLRVSDSPDALPIDTFYQELSVLYPEFFPVQIENEADQLKRLGDAAVELKKIAGNKTQAVNPFEDIAESFASDLANRILYGFDRLARVTPGAKHEYGALKNEQDVREAYAEGTADAAFREQSAYERGEEAGRKRNEKEVQAAYEREEIQRQIFERDFREAQNNFKHGLEQQNRKIIVLERRIERRSENNRLTMARKQTLATLNRLNTMLTKPNRSKHIPQELRAPVARLLASLGTTRLPNGKTMNALEMLAINDAEYGRFEAECARAADDMRMAVSANRVSADNAVTNQFIDAMTANVERLKQMYAEMNPASPDDVVLPPDLAVSRQIDYIRQVGRILGMVEHYVKDSNVVFLNNKAVSAKEFSEHLVNDLRIKNVKVQKNGEASRLREFISGVGYEFVSADLFFEMMGESGVELMREYRRGQTRQAAHEQEFADYMLEVTGGKYSTHDVGFNGELIPLSISSNGLKVTKSQLMQLYITWKRPAGRRHLMSGGAAFTNEVGQEAKINTIRITQDIYDDLIAHLSDEDKKVADAIGGFLSRRCAEWGNEASMKMYGYRMFEDPFYFPLDVSKNVLPANWDSLDEFYRLENAGMTKALKSDASAPLRMTDIFDIADHHVRTMAAYSAFAPVSNDVQRIMNMPNVREAVNHGMGKKGVQYLDTLMKTIASNKVRNGDMSDAAAPLQFFMNAYKRQAVAFNLSTAIKQPLSIVRALNEIDGKYIRQAPTIMAKAEYQRIYDTMLEHSGVAKMKMLGFSDTGFAKSMRQIYDTDYTRESGVIRGTLAKTKGGRNAIKAYDKITDAGMWAAGKMDEVTWVRLWKACELEVADKFKGLSQKDAVVKTAERFNEIIGQTQVVDTILDTSPLMRNKAMSILTPFMNEPTKSLATIITAADAVRDGKSYGKQKLRKAVGLVMLNNLVLEPIISTLMTMWRDEEDDTENLADFAKKFLKLYAGVNIDDGFTFTEFATSNAVSGAFSFPIVQIFYDTFSDSAQNYSNEKVDTAALTNLIKNTKNLLMNLPKAKEDRAKSNYKLFIDFLGSAAAAVGIPLPTLRRQVSAMYRTALNLTDSYELQWEYNKMLYNMENSSARSQKNFYDIMAAAYKASDTEAYNKMRRELAEIVSDTPSVISPKSIEDAIVKRGAKIETGTDLWYVDLQARFYLEKFVPQMKAERLITEVYAKADKKKLDAGGVLLNMPSVYEYENKDGEEKRMTTDEYDEYIHDVGLLSYQVLVELASTSRRSAWSSLTLEQQIYAIEQAYKYSKAKFKADFNPDYNINSQGKWMTELYSKNAGQSEIASTIISRAKAYEG